MIINVKTLLEEKLSQLFACQNVKLTEPWEQCDYTQSYKTEVGGKRFYLKGTPRSRQEARVTSLLHSLCPDLIPKVLIEDFIPAADWRWSLLEDAGECNHKQCEPDIAVEAACLLGKLQKKAAQDGQLVKILPHCQATQILETVDRVCQWALRSVTAGEEGKLLSFHKRIMQSTSFFQDVADKLQRLPSSCVHGDFWSGNIAVKEGDIRLIDWADTFWGVASISIENLIESSGGAFLADAGKIWEAYARGWETEIDIGYIQASRIAVVVGWMLVNMEIAKCCHRGVDMTPGLFPDLQRLADNLR